VTPQLRLLFDDCISKKAVIALKALADFTDGQVEVAHLADFALSGQRDDDWIPQIPDKTWIVVTTDRGKKNRGGKLPLLCQRYGITHVMLTAAIHVRNTFEKIRALFGVWPELLAAASGPAGAGYILKAKNRGDGVELICVYEPPSDANEPKTTQLELDNM
jgi:hypothetical protein